MRCWWLLLGAILPGCELAQCEALCARNATCTEEEIEGYGSSWEEFTGFASRNAYETACMTTFEESLESGSSRNELEQVCRDELERDPCAD